MALFIHPDPDGALWLALGLPAILAAVWLVGLLIGTRP
jgi:hypothetical protein